MANAIFPLAVPANEPVRSYAPGSPEKQSLKQRLREFSRGCGIEHERNVVSLGEVGEIFNRLQGNLQLR